jgi:hypothetical protein
MQADTDFKLTSLAFTTILDFSRVKSFVFMMELYGCGQHHLKMQ